jgi:UDP-N-acetylmuramoyl-L-alanyl-D-glutamate--2,6-diaminopimelate ligase
MRLSELIKRAGISDNNYKLRITNYKSGMLRPDGGGGKDDDPEITGVYSDSRQVEAGSLFVAVKGTAVDGHDFIEKAIEKGASVVVCERTTTITNYELQITNQSQTDGALLNAQFSNSVSDASTTLVAERSRSINFQFSILLVPDSADALGRLAAAWYGEPSRQMMVVGVTGTNGKTTIATLLYHLFRKLGYKAGLLSTICNYINDEPVPTDHTTPDPLTIQRLMARMVDAGCEYAFMEVSSHAIDQKRISGIDFNGGIFTNLTRDHLDYHHTFKD